MVEIKIRYHTELYGEMEKIKKISKGDWIDLRSAEDVNLKVGDFRIVSFGISMMLPKGYEANIVPRGSTFKTWGILQTNHFGVVDCPYCGDSDIWSMPVYATRDTEIKKGDRIAQFRINEVQPTIVFEEVDHLTGENRGGFGSTGTGSFIKKPCVYGKSAVTLDNCKGCDFVAYDDGGVICTGGKQASDAHS